MSIIIHSCQISIHHQHHRTGCSRLRSNTKIGILPNLLLREFGSELAKLAFDHVIPFIADQLRIPITGIIDCTIAANRGDTILCPQHTYIATEHYNHEVYVQFNANVNHNAPRQIEFLCTPTIIENCKIG